MINEKQKILAFFETSVWNAKELMVAWSLHTETQSASSSFIGMMTMNLQ